MFRRAKAFLSLALCALGVLLGSLLVEQAAQASTPPGGSGFKRTSYSGEAGNVEKRCKEIREEIKSDDKDGVWLSEYIVTCVRTVVTEAFVKLVEGIYPAVEGSVRAGITLAVVVFGVMLASGLVEKTARDTFVLLLKIACILFFMQVSTVKWVFEVGLDSMDELTDLVFQFGKGSATGRCSDNETLWDRVDCMLDTIIGIKDESTGSAPGNDEGIERGLIHFFFSNMVSSGVGFIIGALGVYVMFSFVMALVKSIHTYLAAILGLGFILIFMPMFVGFILFKATKNYFDKWYRIAISMILQPVILFGFLSLMMIAMDKVLVSGDHSMLNTATGGRCTNETISRCYENNGVFTNQTMSQFHDVADPAEVAAPHRQQVRGLVRAPSRPDVTMTEDSTAYQTLFRSTRSFDAVDYERLAQLMGASDDTEAQEKLMLSTITLTLTMFVFLTMLNYIPNMATDLAGGIYEVPNLYQQVGSDFIGRAQMEQVAGNASQRIRRAIDPGSGERLVDRFSALVGRRDR